MLAALCHFVFLQRKDAIELNISHNKFNISIFAFTSIFYVLFIYACVGVYVSMCVCEGRDGRHYWS